MADKSNRFEDSIPGKWYVDSECIDCDLCNGLAPQNFKPAVTDDHSIVYKQPDSKAEEDACFEAMDGCPVEAIGNDGAGS